MMEESLHGEFRLSSLGHGHQKRRRAVHLPRTVYATLVHTFYPALRHRSTRLAHWTCRSRIRRVAPGIGILRHWRRSG